MIVSSLAHVLALALALVAASPTSPAPTPTPTPTTAPATSAQGGSVIVGASTIDATETDLVSIDAATGARTLLAHFDHERGRPPKGTLAGARLVTTSRVQDGTHTVVEASDGNGAHRRVIGTGAIELQAPVVVDSSSVQFIRQPREGVFEVVRVRGNGSSEGGSGDVDGNDGDGNGVERVVATFEGTWLTVASGDSRVFLAIDADGGNRIVELKDVEGAAANGAGTLGVLHTRFTLGQGRYRSPAVVHANLSGALAHASDTVVVLERAVDERHAQIVDASDGSVLLEGLPGMDPLALGDRVVVGSGKKHAALLVARIARERGRAHLADVVTLDAGTAGVATPKAAAVVAGAVVAVAWLDRGASLPGELWSITSSAKGSAVNAKKPSARRLIDPTPGYAVEVYGVVDGGSAR